MLQNFGHLSAEISVSNNCIFCSKIDSTQQLVLVSDSVGQVNHISLNDKPSLKKMRLSGLALL